MNSPEINPSKIRGGVNVGENLETNLPLESGSEALEAGEITEKEVESLEEKLENLGGPINELQEMSASNRKEFDGAREELGLPPSEKNLPTEDELEKLRAEQKTLEQQQNKERLIQEEKEKILQEKLDELFKQFESFAPKDFKVILKNGMENSPFGAMDEKTTKSLVESFKAGIKLLPQILEKLPDILEKFDKDLTEEATERIEKKLEKDKKEPTDQKQERVSEGVKLEEAASETKDQIPTAKMKQRSSAIREGGPEAPKQ
ncbi:MAG: hypothetical protein Q7S10_01460 [bacterium]|nr:hypothetical protein [bacterium]